MDLELIRLWDNRCALHRALGSFDLAQRRHMEPTTVLDSPSRYPVASA